MRRHALFSCAYEEKELYKIFFIPLVNSWLKSIEHCYSFAGNAQTKEQTVTKDSSLIHISEDKNEEHVIYFMDMCAQLNVYQL